MSEYQNNSIFWVETEKIQPNPFQPRREFDQHALEDLADSIRQYGVLQPLVVTRKENIRDDGDGMDVHYELVAGERRLRASKIAGLQQVPIIIRKDTDNKIKLELAIIENLQREDLNPVDRAMAFEQLYKEFKLTHADIGKRMGKSRVYVSNTLRLLGLPDYIKEAVINRQITEGHTRPLLMLSDRPDQQKTLFKEILVKKMSVRDSEKVARKIAQDKVRKKEFVVDPKILEMEKKLSENLGTRVHIEAKENGGQVMIDYFTLSDLQGIVNSLKEAGGATKTTEMMDNYIQNKKEKSETLAQSTPITVAEPEPATPPDSVAVPEPVLEESVPVAPEVTPEPMVEEPAVVPEPTPVVEEIPASVQDVSEPVNKIPGIPEVMFSPGPAEEAPVVPLGVEEELVDLEAPMAPETPVIKEQPTAPTFDDTWISFSPGGFNDDPISSYSQEQKEEVVESAPEPESFTPAYTPRDEGGNEQDVSAQPKHDPYLEPISDEDTSF